jgi:type I restriction enzyme R subunit
MSTTSRTPTAAPDLQEADPVAVHLQRAPRHLGRHQGRVGTLTSPWERFAPWRTVDGQAVARPDTLELSTLLTASSRNRRFLELVRSFVVFEDSDDGVMKKLAGYHQVGAVREALRQTVRATRPRGNRKVGVVWHTQGSGKSLTMAFYAGRVIDEPAMDEPDDRGHHRPQRPRRAALRHVRALPRAPAPDAGPGRATATHLRGCSRSRRAAWSSPRSRSSSRPSAARSSPLSDRRNVVVIADEAHRSQYGFRPASSSADGGRRPGPASRSTCATACRTPRSSASPARRSS